MKPLLQFAWLLLVASLSCPTAAADDDASANNEWEYSVLPYVWSSALEGRVRIGPFEADVNAGFSDLIRNQNFVVQVHGEARRGRLTFFGDVIWMPFGDDRRRGAFELTITGRTSIVEGGAKYRVASIALDNERNVHFQALVGARYWRVRNGFELPGFLPTFDQKEHLLDLIVGGVALVELSERWALQVRADLGGFGFGSGTEHSLNLRALLRYELSDRWTTTFGYALLDTEFERGSRARRLEVDLLRDGVVLGFERRF